MNMLKRYKVLLPGLLLLLFSCQQDGLAPDTIVKSGSGNIRLQTNIVQKAKHYDLGEKLTLRGSDRQALGSGKLALNPPSSAADFVNQFSAGDQIGVFMVAAGENLAATGNLLQNVAFTYDGSSWSSNAAWPAGVSFDVYAYYPYNSALSNALGAFFAVQSDQSKWANFQKSDLMWAKASSVQVGTAVNLTFAHLLSLLQVDMGPGNYTGGPDEHLDVQLYQLSNEGRLNLATGTFTVTNNSRPTIRMYRVEEPSNSTSFTYRALLPSQTLAAGKQLLLLNNGPQSMGRTQPTELPLLQGAAHHFAVKEVHSLMKWVYIPPGIFPMGSPDTDPNALAIEKSRHWVKVEKGFYMSKYETTVAQYCDFLNATQVKGQYASDYFVNLPLNGNTMIGVNSSNQISNSVRWNSGVEKWEPAAGSGNLPLGQVSFFGAFAYAQWAGGTLPSEAQWEYASRAGTETIWFFADVPALLGDYAWTVENSDLVPQEVGIKKPNAWGLYDSYGSVWEWCIYVGAYPTNENDYPKTNPKIYNVNANITPSSQALRGGSYYDSQFKARSAARLVNPTLFMGLHIGFRMIITP